MPKSAPTEPPRNVARYKAFSGIRLLSTIALNLSKPKRKKEDNNNRKNNPFYNNNQCDNLLCYLKWAI